MGVCERVVCVCVCVCDALVSDAELPRRMPPHRCHYVAACVAECVGVRNDTDCMTGMQANAGGVSEHMYILLRSPTPLKSHNLILLLKTLFESYSEI